MNAYLIILKQTYYERRNIGSMWIFWTAAVIPLIAVPIFGLLSKEWAITISKVMGSTYSLLFYLFWTHYVENAISQNRPVNAKLVPALRQRLVIATFGAWLAGSTLLAAIWSIGFGHFFQIWMCIALISLFIVSAGLFRSWMHSIFLGSFIALSNYLSLFKLFFALDLSYPVTIGILGIAIYSGARIINAGFSRCGENHSYLHTKRALLKQKLEAKRAMKPTRNSRLSAKLSALFGYDFSPAGIGKKPVPKSKLVCHVFRPSYHWWKLVSITLLVFLGVIFTLALAFFILFDSETVLRAHELLLSFLVLSIVWFSPILFISVHHTAVYSTQKEQSLLRLAPNIPLGSDLNQILARTSLQYFGTIWCICACITAVLITISPTREFIIVATATASFALLLAGLYVRDYARTTTPTSSLVITPLFSIMFATFAVLLISVKQPTHFGKLFAECFLISALFTWYRWQKISKAPIAIPAGRLAA